MRSSGGPVDDDETGDSGESPRDTQVNFIAPALLTYSFIVSNVERFLSFAKEFYTYYSRQYLQNLSQKITIINVYFLHY